MIRFEIDIKEKKVCYWVPTLERCHIDGGLGMIYEVVIGGQVVTGREGSNSLFLTMTVIAIK